MKLNTTIASIIDSYFGIFSNTYSLEYEYDSLSETHFLLIPKKIYECDDFVEFDIKVTKSLFEEININLCFIHEESPTRLYNSETIINFISQEVILQNLFGMSKKYPKNTVEILPEEFWDVGESWTDYDIETSSGDEFWYYSNAA